MKTNLKNFPPERGNEPDDMDRELWEIHAWKINFEKELRDILKWKGKPLKPEWKEQIEGQKKLAREILGEEK